MLKPEETNLIGNWRLDGSRMVADAVEVRIRLLVEHHLEKIAVGNWHIFCRDPADGRYWELTCPHGEMHGGGPMRLTNLNASDAAAKYQLGKMVRASL